tara:strand:+ start:39 stop:482 length:444 start_codon:yes stop_codon:yes gene_type:complete
MLDRLFFQKLGIKVRDDVRDHLFEKARDVKDNKFKTYSTEYGKQKRKGSGKRQDSNYASSLAPVFSGDLMLDLTVVNPTNNSVKVGWVKSGVKINSLNKKGRFITTSDQPFPKGTIRMIMREAKIAVKKKVKAKFPDGKVIRLPIGK